jgi:hypothetical protein
MAELRAEDDFHTLLRCRRRSLWARLDRLFDNGAGHINPALIPLVDALAAMEVPRGGLSSLSHAATVERVHAIATGQAPLSHEGIDQLPASNGREHLRELLVVHHILPARDRYLAAFERWAAHRVAAISDPHDRRLIAAYPRWHHRPRLERLAADCELTENRDSTARAQPTSPSDCWPGSANARSSSKAAPKPTSTPGSPPGPAPGSTPDPFLRWAIRTRRRATLDLPADRQATPDALPEAKRLELLARLLADDTIDDLDGVAGILVLLYALPASRINRLRLTDLHPTADGLTLRLGPDPMFVPARSPPSSTNSRTTGVTATAPAIPTTNGSSPVGRAGQPIEPDQLAERLNRLGNTRAARSAALNALLTDVPPPCSPSSPTADPGESPHEPRPPKVDTTQAPRQERR